MVENIGKKLQNITHIPSFLYLSLIESRNSPRAACINSALIPEYCCKRPAAYAAGLFCSFCMIKSTPEQRSGVLRIGLVLILLHALGHSNSTGHGHTAPQAAGRPGAPSHFTCAGRINRPLRRGFASRQTARTRLKAGYPWSVWQKAPRSAAPGCFVLVLCDSYFMLSATATAQATVIPTMGLLPAPRKPIIST